DLQHALKFLVRYLQQLAAFPVLRLLAEQVKQVSDRIQRIVDFVRQRGGDAPRGRELVAGAEGSFRTFAIREIAERQHCSDDLPFDDDRRAGRLHRKEAAVLAYQVILSRAVRNPLFNNPEERAILPRATMTVGRTR